MSRRLLIRHGGTMHLRVLSSVAGYAGGLGPPFLIVKAVIVSDVEPGRGEGGDELCVLGGFVVVLH